MITLDLQSDVKSFVRGLNNMQRKQIPFATARALTWAAKEAQKDIQRAIPATFAVTRKWWLAKQPTGIKIAPATKLNPVAVVYTDAYFARLQEEGGIKRPFRHRGILVPSARVPKYGRKAGGSTKVLAGKRILKSGGRAGGDPIVTLPSGKKGIFRRRGKKRLPIDLLYSFVPEADIHPRMNLKAMAALSASKKFGGLFAKSLALALKSAR